MIINPLFSIISVTLNNHNGLLKTYHSLQAQTYTNYEWIVIDGQSTDATLKFLENKNVTLISEPDNGIYDAMNKGIETATGQYLIFMNAGDSFASPEALFTISHTIEKDKPDFIYGDALEILKSKEIYKPSHTVIALPYGMITHHQAMVYRRQIIGKLRYDEHYQIAADYDFTCRFVKKSQKFSYINFPLCLFESGGVSEQNALKGRIEQFKIRRNLNVGLWDTSKIFMLQTSVYIVRKISPSLYWRLKNFATRL